MKKSVGLVVMVKMPQEDGSEVLMAVLQRRGRFNTEKMKPESYPGCCQVTCHGGIKDQDFGGKLDVFHTGLIRESIEELGAEFTGACVQDIRLIKITDTNPDENPDKERVITYGALVPSERLKMIRLGPDSGGLDLVRKEEVSGAISVLVVIKPEYKVSGPPAGVRALFLDEIHAIETAFEVFAEM